MKIKSIKVKGLFGIFDHEVPMNLGERVTIIHGPNGVGKTALFRLLRSLSSGSYRDLHTIPYHIFEVSFDDTSYIRVTKVSINESNQYSFQDEAFQELQDLEITFQLPITDPTTFTIRRAARSISFRQRRALSQLVPGLTRIDNAHFRYSRTGEILTLENAIEKFGDYLPNELKTENIEPAAYEQLRKSVDVHIIDTQRLIDLVPSSNPDEDKSSRVQEAVLKYSKELVLQLQYALGQYAALSQSLDRTFPQRLIQSTITLHPISEDLGKKLGELEEKRTTLMEAGLLDKESAMVSNVPRNLDENTKRVLEIYVADVEQKLSVFDTIAAKIDVFKSIIDQRFLYKKIRISRREGFNFVSTGDDKKLLLPNQLSSGEQHEVVLFYELLFKIKAGALILIDEPELSLHVAWQVEFLKDLKKVTNLAFIDVLIATHSPQIINNRWDLTVELKGPNQ